MPPSELAQQFTLGFGVLRSSQAGVGFPGVRIVVSSPVRAVVEEVSSSGEDSSSSPSRAHPWVSSRATVPRIAAARHSAVRCIRPPPKSLGRRTLAVVPLADFRNQARARATNSIDVRPCGPYCPLCQRLASRSGSYAERIRLPCPEQVQSFRKVRWSTVGLECVTGDPRHAPIIF